MDVVERGELSMYHMPMPLGKYHCLWYTEPEVTYAIE